MKRPTFLTVWLILIAVADVFSLISYTVGASALTTMMPNFPAWTLWVYDALIVVQLVSVVLLWMWKKIGFYLIVGCAIIAAIVNIYALGVSGVIGVIFGLAGVGILYLAMRPAWEQFK